METNLRFQEHRYGKKLGMSASDANVPGLRYLPDYISTEVETSLLAAIDQQEWDLRLKRRTQHYGYRYDYTKKRIDKNEYLGPLPSFLDSVLERLLEFDSFDQVICNEYLPGQGIAPHIDCVPCFGPVVISLSLSSGCTMEFTNSVSHSVYLQPRSLVVLSGDARYRWAHSIAQRKQDVFIKATIERGRRVSLTFRTVLH